MKITLKEILKSNPEPIVQFDCKYGASAAMWIGSAPSLNSDYQVELDCDETLVENSNFKRSCSTTPRLWMEDKMVHVTIVIEDVYEDSTTAILRLGDSVMLIDYEGTFPSAGTWIELSLGELKLNDIGL